MTTLADIRAFVRLWLDVDEEDTPSAVIDHGIREACRIIWRRAPWSWAREKFTLNLVAGTATYTLASVTSPSTNGATLHRVYSIYYDNVDGQELVYADLSDAFRKYRTLTTGKPLEWTQDGQSLTVWPVPDNVYTLTIYGTRGPLDWVAQGDNAVPDLPEEYVDLVKTWALHTAYLHQDDPEMAGETQNLFQSGLNQLAVEDRSVPDAQPVVINAGVQTYDPTAPDRLRYPFD